MATAERRTGVATTERADNAVKRDRGREWLLSALMLVALGCAAAGLGAVLADIRWWFVMMLEATIVLLTAAVVRHFARGRFWPTLAGFVAAVTSITLMFAPATAILWIIPTFDTVDALRELEQAGLTSIAEQDIPADAVAGIVYLLCVGIAAISLAMDTAAHLLRATAVAGVPLLALLLVPSFVRTNLGDPFLFALTAAAFLAMLLVRARPGGRRLAVGIGAATIALALIFPLALPTVRQGELAGGSGGSVATGINPIVTLGDDLRRGDPSLALTYTTTSTEPLYLRLTALDAFSGISWVPTSTEVDPSNRVSNIGPVPGLGANVPTSQVLTQVSVGNILSRWLPVPYAPETIEGLVGEWAWEGAALAVRTEQSNARGQEYTVESVSIAPSIEQLVAAGTVVQPGLERYLDVPDDLPAVVGETALEVVGDAASNYDKAVALQSFFTGGEFQYSEEAPVEQGYDGSGATVLAEFLDARSGYCVHFSSAMAAMARTLGIPARVAVGFTPGEPGASTPVGEESGEDAVLLTEYRVTTHNFHAWPELYFDGIGWVRFEPTPGRGEAPRFAPLIEDDPATPDVDESVPPAPEATAGPTTAPTALPEDEQDDPAEGTTPGEVATASSVPWWWSLIAVLLLIVVAPFVVRQLRRQRRMGEVADGSSVAGWEELRDTADDLGLRTTDSRTPRQLSDDLAPHLDDRGAAALARLRASLESESYAGRDGEPALADVRTVTRALRRSAPLGTRILARVLPRSLFTKWLGQLRRAD
ncbi:DUF3488 and transglutaminase-like domain-containing protein [soil metagenome]